MREALLNVREVGALLHIHPTTIYAWAAAGKLPSLHIHGTLRFERQAVDAFIETRRGRFIDPAALTTNILVDLDNYDRLHLQPTPGGHGAVEKNMRRWSYSFGSVYERETKRGQSWCIDYRDQHGKRIREVVKHATTRGEALIALQSKVAERFNGHFAPDRTAAQMAFGDFADRFINEYAKSEKKSWQTDEFRLCRLREFFGGLKMSAVTEAKIREFRGEMLSRGLAELTTNRQLALLKKMFNWGIAQGLLTSNPVKAVRLFSEKDTARDRVLRPDEEAKLFAELKPRLRPFIMFLLHSGLRYREGLNLPWAAVDFARRRIKVERTKTKTAREIPMNTTVFSLLGELKSRATGALVFPFDSARTAFENAVERAGLGDFTFHDLRRTFGTRLLERGANIVTIQKLYGHASAFTTLRYLHPDDKLSVEAVELLVCAPAKTSPEAENLSRAGHAAEESAFPVPQAPDLSAS